jgi:LPXTG-site transpeptidase (sortase) family protein
MCCMLWSFFALLWNFFTDQTFFVGARLHRKRAFYGLGRSVLVAGLVALNLVFASGTALAEGPASKKSAIPTRLIIPSIAVDSEIEPVGSYVVEINDQKYRQWDTSINHVGWHNRSARLGQAGNTVLAGHSDIFAMVFENLRRLEPGEAVYVTSGDQVYGYIISEVVEVQEAGVSLAQRVANGRLISDTEDERLTLITCSRPGATHRIVVVARPVDVSPVVHNLAQFAASNALAIAAEARPAVTELVEPADDGTPAFASASLPLPVDSEPGLWLKRLVY